MTPERVAHRRACMKRGRASRTHEKKWLRCLVTLQIDRIQSPAPHYGSARWLRRSELHRISWIQRPVPHCVSPRLFGIPLRFRSPPVLFWRHDCAPAPEMLEEDRGVEPLTFPTLTGSNRVASLPSSIFRCLVPPAGLEPASFRLKGVSLRN